MRAMFGKAATAVALGGVLLAGSGTAAQAGSYEIQTVGGCYANKTGTHTARGGCTVVNGGSSWRLGVICSKVYSYSPWINWATTTSASCAGTITHAWIDTWG